MKYFYLLIWGEQTEEKNGYADIVQVELCAYVCVGERRSPF